MCGNLLSLCLLKPGRTVVLETAGEASIMQGFLTYWFEDPHLFCASYTDSLQGDTRSVCTSGTPQTCIWSFSRYL